MHACSGAFENIMYEDLEPIANLKYGQAIGPIVEDMQKQLAEAAASFGARGLSQSGPFENEKLKIRVKASEKICRVLYGIWLELILRKSNGRITREDIAFIMTKLEVCAGARARDIQSVSSSPVKTAEDFIKQQSNMQMQNVVGAIRTELEIKLREQEAFPTTLKSFQPETASEEVFIIVGASDDLNRLVEEALKPAVKDNALQPYVMVAREPEGPIGNEILARIEAARLVIADLTNERPNCYYEVGYAHARGKKVIFSVREDHNPRRPGRNPDDPKVHFDLDNHRFSFWKEGEWTRLRVELRDRIKEYLKTETIRDRRSEAGEEEVLTYMRHTQETTRGRVFFNIRAVAQELGWPTDDVEVVLGRLAEKSIVKAEGDGKYTLTSFTEPA